MVNWNARSIALLALAACCLAGTAQANVWHQRISRSSVDLSGGPVVLGQVTTELPNSGLVIVQFDGYGCLSVGDRITLAASDTTNWGVNDGNVGIEAYNADQNCRPFSHTRSYRVSAGTHTFYAVGQNYVETDGSGIASIRANLTVKFYPDTGSDAFADHIGFSQVGIDFSGDDVNLGEISIAAPVAGRVVVRFDGKAVSSPGDRIVLAANDVPVWEPDNGNTTLEAFDSDLNRTSFSHTRVFDIDAGEHTFYAAGQNYVEKDGTGIASVYGSLTVEFFPDAANEPSVEHVDINKTSIDLRGADVVLAQIDFDASTPGDVVLRFDGVSIADVGDRILLAANDAPVWEANDGNVPAEAVDSDVNRTPFSHSRVYSVEAGNHSFYAVGENYVEQDGSGVASTYGRLTLQFFPVPEPTPALLHASALAVLALLARVARASKHPRG